MYHEDQALVEDWCNTPDRLVKVGTMVLLSIRMQWIGVGNQMIDVDKHGEDSICLWGFKRDGYRYLVANRERLYERLQAARDGEIWIEDLVREFLKVPGLGLAKAGFLTQLTTGMCGCLDMHNVEIHGLTPLAWHIRPRVDPQQQLVEIDSKIELYMGLVDECGGPGNLWNDWCRHLAETVSTFEGAGDVSRRHYYYLLDLPGDDDDGTHDGTRDLDQELEQ